jgi:hypothetical protein
MRIQALLAPLIGLLISFCAQAQDQTLSPGYVVVDGRADCKVFTNFTKDKTIKWNGQCVNGFADGLGASEHFVLGKLILTADGNYSQGKMLLGTLIGTNGYKYVGEFKDVKFHGQGTMTAANGDKYVGEFKDSKFNGQGISTYANGDKYVGEFKDGKANGQGTFIYANVGKYVGEFNDGKRNGQGIFTLSNGGGFNGEWKDEKPHGRGIETYANGSPAKEGIFDKGIFIRAEKVSLPPIQQQADGTLSEERRKQNASQPKSIEPSNKSVKLPMITVINDCQTHHKFDNFSDWATCIKLSYTQYGTSPNEPAVLNFGAYLDSIDEDYKAGKVSFVKARVQMIEAWRNTIEADNLRNAVPTVTQNVPAQGGGNAWSKAHEIIKGIDPATNQKMVDQMCYSNCIGTEPVNYSV